MTKNSFVAEVTFKLQFLNKSNMLKDYFTTIFIKKVMVLIID